ncbi:hypothetical protein SUGI_0860350 [Cryptomeria japonica]|nr:hypothetical protein SUGI_0860350 [Cryptomeria japonica]
MYVFVRRYGVRWTENNNVVGTTRGANEFAGVIALGITVGLGTLVLEYHRVVCGMAVADIGTSAAILVSLKDSADNFTSAIHLQFSGAHSIHVGFACRGGALSIGRSDGKRNVEAVYQRDVVKVLVASSIEGVLGQRGGNGSRGLAAQLAATVTGFTASSASRIERAASSAPEFSRLCRRRQINRPCLTLVQLLPCSG